MISTKNVDFKVIMGFYGVLFFTKNMGFKVLMGFYGVFFFTVEKKTKFYFEK